MKIMTIWLLYNLEWQTAARCAHRMYHEKNVEEDVLNHRLSRRPLAPEKEKKRTEKDVGRTKGKKKKIDF